MNSEFSEAWETRCSSSDSPYRLSDLGPVLYQKTFTPTEDECVELCLSMWDDPDRKCRFAKFDHGADGSPMDPLCNLYANCEFEPGNDVDVVYYIGTSLALEFLIYKCVILTCC